jgi:hypothetical protein
MSRYWFAVTLSTALLSGQHAAGVVLVTTEVTAQSTAEFNFEGTPYEAQQSVTGIATASSQALAGSMSTPEARTAARVSLDEMAANARLDGKMHFGPTDVQTNFSTAIFTAFVQKISGGPEHVMMDFFLPPSEVETTTNAEIPFAEVEAAIFAWIETRSCVAPDSCTGAISRHFDFQAYIIGDWQSYGHLAHATGDPGLDVSPLLNPTLTDTPGFFRTVNLSLPEYAGTLDLGVLLPGQTMQVEYIMQARAIGFASANVAIAGINDPFFIDSDPVTPGAPAVFRTVQVPEPASFMFCLAGGLLAIKRPRRWGR